MRVTFQNSYNTLLHRMQNLGAAQQTALTQLSSGQRITVASDDPAAMGRVLNMRAEKSQQQQFWSNANRALSVSQSTFSVFDQLNKAGVRATELAIAGGTDTAPASALASYGIELNELLENAVATANSKFQGGYLLAGTAISDIPFAVTRDADGRISGVAYAGASDDGAAFRISETEIISPSATEAENRAVGDFLNNLVAVRDALLSGQHDAVTAARPALAASEDVLLAGLSRAGGIQYRLEIGASDATRRFDAIRESVSKEADVDFAEASVRLSLAQTAYQAAIQGAAKVFDNSLLDYLR